VCAHLGTDISHCVAGPNERREDLALARDQLAKQADRPSDAAILTVHNERAVTRLPDLVEPGPVEQPVPAVGRLKA